MDKSRESCPPFQKNALFSRIFLLFRFQPQALSALLGASVRATRALCGPFAARPIIDRPDAKLAFADAASSLSIFSTIVASTCLKKTLLGSFQDKKP